MPSTGPCVGPRRPSSRSHQGLAIARPLTAGSDTRAALANLIMAFRLLAPTRTPGPLSTHDASPGRRYVSPRRLKRYEDGSRRVARRAMRGWTLRTASDMSEKELAEGLANDGTRSFSYKYSPALSVYRSRRIPTPWPSFSVHSPSQQASHLRPISVSCHQGLLATHSLPFYLKPSKFEYDGIEVLVLRLMIQQREHDLLLVCETVLGPPLLPRPSSTSHLSMLPRNKLRAICKCSKCINGSYFDRKAGRTVAGGTEVSEKTMREHRAHDLTRASKDSKSISVGFSYLALLIRLITKSNRMTRTRIRWKTSERLN
jgi:hypothetical protein